MPGWNTVTIRGKSINTLQQSGAWACGLCCAAMAINWTGNGRPSESTLSGKGSGYDPDIGDKAGWKATPLVGLRAHVSGGGSLPDPGMTGASVANLLNLPGLKATRTRNPSADACKDACRDTPADGTGPVILGLVDPPHFVICHSHVRRIGRFTIHLIADPDDGQVFEGHIEASGGRPVLTSISDNRYGAAVIDDMIVVSKA